MLNTSVSPALARRLRALRARIEANAIPPSAPGSHLKIATWNIREFGRRPRRPESLLYIAEVLAQFDLIAIVELRENLADFDVVLSLLGPTWRAIFTAPIFDHAGNRERATYLFDTRVIRHTGLASGVQAPRTKRGKEYLSKIAWWREPFLASFQAGDRDLLLLTAHMRWAGDDPRSRLRELELLASWVETELAKDPFSRARELVVLGDFNVPSTRSPLFDAITRRGLRVPDALLGTHGSNLAQDKRYDQILHLPASSATFTGRGGALDFYTGGIADLYPPSVSPWAFTFELSDHLPLWVQLSTRDRPEARDAAGLT